MNKFSDQAYALMRIVLGLLFASHGAQILFGMFGGIPVPHTPLIVAAGTIELVCGLSVALGLFGRVGAFIASGQMAAAYFMAHAPHGFWPIQNQGEPAVVYCFVFLYMSTRGSGIWSFDRLMRLH